MDAVSASDLDDRTAAVELGNVLRPTIAVAWLGTFLVLALIRATEADPGLRDRLAAPAADAERLAFAHEVRRTTPFVPALAGRVRQDARHGELGLRRGDRIVLDVRGINHDPQLHPSPHLFVPDRFLRHQPGLYDLVPQGGGSVAGHRCPGESMTLQLLAETVRVFAGPRLHVVSYPQADLRRMPTLPADGLRLRL